MRLREERCRNVRDDTGRIYCVSAVVHCKDDSRGYISISSVARGGAGGARAPPIGL